MTSLQYCSRCEGSISKTDHAHHTRDRRILCEACHELEVQEIKSKAKRHMAEASGRPRSSESLKTGLIFAAVIVIAVAGIGFIMSSDGEKKGANAKDTQGVTESPEESTPAAEGTNTPEGTGSESSKENDQ